jgi:hypothetical protein
VLAPLFRHLVDTSARVSVLPNAGPPFRLTAHVGEDFRHLLEGLRRIYEQISTHGIYEHICSPRRVSRFLLNYLDDEDIFKKGQELVDVPIREDEVEALSAVQYALRRGISQRGIVVEVNPSSNLLVGDLLDLRNHPILRLCPPVPEDGGPPPIAIAVGSDDPVTFSTKLMHEYTLLHQAARSAGYSERVVQQWLETIRGTGMDARFTVAWAPSALCKSSKLMDDLSRYLHEPRGVSIPPECREVVFHNPSSAWSG